MKFSLFLPHPALCDYIDNVTIVSFDFDIEKDISPIYSFIPSHTRFMCFYLQDKLCIKKDGEFSLCERSIIIGPQTKPVILDLGRKHMVLLVNLKPGGMYRLLGIPMNEIVDKDFDARSILGNEVDLLLARLRDAKTDEIRNQIVQLYLLQRLDSLLPCLPFDRAMLQLVKNRGNLNMDFVASQACMSLRQFERKSLERIGFSPKYFARMIRFSHAFKLKELSPHKSWTIIAHECGYFDQMHFIRDFKNFAGYTPSGLTESDIINSVRYFTLEDR